MPRHALLAVLLLACMVGGLLRPFDEGHQTRTRTSLDAAAALGVAAGVPKVRTKPQPDSSSHVGPGVEPSAALLPIDLDGRIEFLDAVLPPRAGQRIRVPARAPPFS